MIRRHCYYLHILVFLVLTAWQPDVVIAQSQVNDKTARWVGRPQIFGVLAHEKDLKRADFVTFFSRYPVLLLSVYDPLLLKLKKYQPRMQLIGMPNPYFYWEPNPEKTVPDWVLRDPNGRPIRYSGPLYAGMDQEHLPVIMDIRVQRWQETFLAGCKAIVDAYKLDGMLMDTWSTTCPLWAYQNQKTPPAGYSPTQWKKAMKQFTKLARDRLGTKTLFLYNGIGSAPPSQDLGDILFLPKTDGTCTEAYSIYMGIDQNEQTRKHYFFHTVMKTMAYVKKTGKYYLLQVSGDENNEKTRLYALASYLLLQYDKSFFYYDKGDEDEPNWFPEWDIFLGKAMGQYTKKGMIYQREFEKAKVWVNPSSRMVVVKLNKTYQTMRHEKIEGSFQLPPFSGVILTRYLEQ